MRPCWPGMLQEECLAACAVAPAARRRPPPPYRRSDGRSHLHPASVASRSTGFVNALLSRSPRLSQGFRCSAGAAPASCRPCAMIEVACLWIALALAASRAAATDSTAAAALRLPPTAAACPCANHSLCRPVQVVHDREVFGFSVSSDTPYERRVPCLIQQRAGCFAAPQALLNICPPPSHCCPRSQHSRPQHTAYPTPPAATTGAS